MKTRTFLKGVLSTPVISFASDIIAENNYGFNFIGNGKVNNITEFGNKNPIYRFTTSDGTMRTIIRVGEYDVYVLMFGHYAKGIEFHKKVIELRKNVDYPESFISDTIYDEMVKYDRSEVEEGRAFMPLSEYHKYPTVLMNKLDQRLKENKYTVDVYTDFGSFKDMLDSKYYGKYSQELLDDVKKVNF